MPDDWTMVIIVPLYKRKGSKSERKSFRGISFISIVGNVYGRIVTDLVGEELGGFSKGRGCVNQASRRESFRMIKKFYVAHMDSEKAYDEVNRKTL